MGVGEIKQKRFFFFFKSGSIHCGAVNTHSSEGVVQIVNSPGNDYNVIDI